MLVEIFIFILTKVLTFFAVLFNYDGSVPLLLPFGIDNALSYAVGLWNSFMVTFPYASVAWHMFLLMLVFEALMLVLKFVLGQRLPVNTV